MYSCVICKDDLPSRLLLHRHLWAHKPWYCNECYHIYNTKRQVQRHKRHLHNDRMPCDICRQTVQRYEEREHRKGHNFKYSIDQLNAIIDIVAAIQGKGTFPSKNARKIEYTGEQIRCPVFECEIKFLTQNDLIQHYSIHRKQHVCEFCREMFSTEEKYLYHKVNKICRMYNCVNCGKDFGRVKFFEHLKLECTEHAFIAGEFKPHNIENKPHNIENKPDNIAYNPSNTAYNPANTALNPANTALNPANTAFNPDNIAYNPSNTAYNPANTALNPANTAYNPANTAYNPANTALNPANTALNPSNIAYNPSNTAYNPANTALNPDNIRKVFVCDEDGHYHFECYVCEQPFDKLQLLKTHLESHEKLLNICLKCFCVFPSKRKLQFHLRSDCVQVQVQETEIPDELRSEINTYITENSEKQNYIQTHKKVYEIADEVVHFQCNCCDIKFVKFKYLKQHCDQFKHDLVLCYRCLYMFNTQDERKKHVCVIHDYDNNELLFRQQFQLHLKRKQDEEEYQSYKNKSDILSRMNVLIQKLENTKFPTKTIDVTKNPKVTPVTPSSIPTTSRHVEANDEFDRDTIISRVLECRKKRLLRKDLVNEDNEEEVEPIKDLDISKKPTEYNLVDEVLPPCRVRDLEARNKRLVKKNDSDESIENISKFLREFDSSSNDEPPNKKNRIHGSDDENDNFDPDDDIWELDIWQELKDVIEENSDEDAPPPNKIPKL